MEAGILNFIFGEMWCRRGLDERSRRWITLVAVADSRCEIPIKSHFHSAMTSGNCKPSEIHEFVLQYAIHAGWPRGSEVQGVVFEMVQKFEAGLPWNG
jgi:4-carboxymuconolactone decarboxylase